MKYLSYLAFLLTTCCGPSLPLPSYQEPESGVEDALNATVALVKKTDDGLSVYCSGVVVGSQVLTAWHCVDQFGEGGMAEVSFRTEQVTGTLFSTSHPYLVASKDALNDLAILVPTSLALPPGSAILAPSAPGYGDKVAIVGHPAGLVWTITEGVVSHPRRVQGAGQQMEGRVWLQVSAPVYFGNSGGPVFNSYGEVVGIVSFLWQTPHLGGAVHLETLRAATGT